MKNIDNEKVIVILPALNSISYRGSFRNLSRHAHVHNSNGVCLKNRYADRCVR